jgi:predicted Ser/Thr protein kinase
MAIGTCPERDELLPVVHGELESGDVAAHVLSCSDCQRAVAELRSLIGMLRQSTACLEAAEPTTVEQSKVGATTVPHYAEKVATAPSQPSAQPSARPAALGKYLIIGELGAGGQARVFRGVHATLQRDVAIKWSHRPVSGAAVDRDQLTKEGRVLAELDHPGLVRVYDLDFHEDRPFLVMEYIRGLNLEQYFQREHPSPRQAASLVARVALALAVVHRRAILHQDIKPVNILIDETGQPRLADFGVARLGGLWSDPDQETWSGTLAYMPAEQLAGAATPASDLYALGGVLFYLLTGQHPRRLTGNRLLAIEKVREGTLDLAPLDDPKLPAKLVRICRKALAKEPGQRYQRAEDLAGDLERFVRRPQQLRRWAGGLAACIAGALLIWGLAHWRETPTAVPSNTLAIRVIRDGNQHLLNSPEEMRKFLPLRAKDQINMAGPAPDGVLVAVFAVTVSDFPELKVVPLGNAPVANDRFVQANQVRLARSPATELLLACGSRDRAATAEEVADLLKELALVAKSRFKEVPRNVLFSFDSARVDKSILLGRAENPQLDSSRLMVDFLEDVRVRFRSRFEFVAGLAFCHVANETRDKAGNAPGGERPIDKAAHDEQDKKDKALFNKVLDRLIASELVRANYPSKYLWPPAHDVAPNSADEFNAYAERLGVDAATNKIKVRAWMTQGYMRQIVQGDEEILAAIMGHELAHITKGHIDVPRAREAGVALAAYSRDQEIQADLEGVKIALSAGYSYSKQAGVRSAFRERKLLGDFSNFEGLKANHPSWNDRLKFLDSDQSQLWTAMAAFRNGYYFLSVEQYQTAANCFKAVTDEFPRCPEAWANLGYARLMQYCDNLDADDVRKLGIGEVVGGCFYKQPGPAVRVGPRGNDEKLWRSAVDVIEKALRLNDELGLAHGNLGLAHLVHADDHQKENLPKALEAFRHAMAKHDAQVDAHAYAALVVNCGVACLADGDLLEAEKLFLAASKSLRIANAKPRLYIDDALLYNIALLRDRRDRDDDKNAAFAALERYLQSTGVETLWRPLAYERYLKLAGELGRKPKGHAALKPRGGGAAFRPVAQLSLSDGKTITLAQPAAAIIERLGPRKASAVPIFKHAKIKRYASVSPGVDVLADDNVLAVFLVDSSAPPVIVQKTGIGAAKREVRVGMAESELAQILATAVSESRYVDNSSIAYTFYPELGLAVRVADGRVTELALAQLPPSRDMRL